MPLLKLINKEISSLSLFEFLLPVLNLGIGLGIVQFYGKRIDPALFLQVVILFIFLELGSQLFEFYKNNYAVQKQSGSKLDERNASILLVVLFYSLSILPLGSMLQSVKGNPSLIFFLAVSGFMTIVWRNFGRDPFGQILSKFIFSINNAFFLPLTQLLFYDLGVKPLLITSSQTFFLYLLGLTILREVIKIELDKDESAVVNLIGTLPMLRIIALLLTAGWVIITAYVIKQPQTELIILSALSAGLLAMIIYRILNLYQFGKLALGLIWRTCLLLILIQYLGWGSYLFIY